MWVLTSSCCCHDPPNLTQTSDMRIIRKHARTSKKYVVGSLLRFLLLRLSSLLSRLREECLPLLDEDLPADDAARAGGGGGGGGAVARADPEEVSASRSRENTADVTCSVCRHRSDLFENPHQNHEKSGAKPLHKSDGFEASFVFLGSSSGSVLSTLYTFDLHWTVSRLCDVGCVCGIRSDGR